MKVFSHQNQKNRLDIKENNMKSHTPRLLNQLALPNEAYQCRDTPDIFYHEQYNKYPDKKWNRVVLKYYLKYPGWSEWLTVNFPERWI